MASGTVLFKSNEKAAAMEALEDEGWGLQRSGSSNQESPRAIANEDSTCSGYTLPFSLQ